jgi:hypothetical protein
MQPAALKIGVLAAGVVAATLSLYPQSTPAQDAGSAEPQAIPPRATPGDYQAHAQVGAVTIAAEFVGHFLPTSQGTLTTEEYVAVETCFFGGPEARMKLSAGDFSLRINGKKTPLSSESYSLVARSVKDPDWEPPKPPKSKSNTIINGSGDDEAAVQRGPKPTPTPVRIPIEVQRAWARRVQKASLAEGDRILPQAGLIFFPYRGKSKDIYSIELIYNGAAGQAALALQP